MARKVGAENQLNKGSPGGLIIPSGRFPARQLRRYYAISARSALKALLETSMYEKTVLDNGLRVLSSELPHTRSVSISLFVGAGSRYESDEQAGVSHFLEHMLFKGTRRRPTPREVSEAIEGVGGVMNAATD